MDFKSGNAVFLIRHAQRRSKRILFSLGVGIAFFQKKKVFLNLSDSFYNFFSLPIYF